MYPDGGGGIEYVGVNVENEASKLGFVQVVAGRKLWIVGTASVDDCSSLDPNAAVIVEAIVPGGGESSEAALASSSLLLSPLLGLDSLDILRPQPVSSRTRWVLCLPPPISLLLPLPSPVPLPERALALEVEPPRWELLLRPPFPLTSRPKASFRERLLDDESKATRLKTRSASEVYGRGADGA